MKSKILFFLLIAFTITTLEAQKNILIGVKGGLNFSDITSEFYTENNSKTGFYLGILSEFKFGDKFAIQPEVLYATYGADVYIMAYGGGPMETKFDLDYVQLPVLGKIYVFRFLSIEIGPSFNFLIYDKGYRPGLDDIFDENGNFVRSQSDIDPLGSKFELSGLVGVSYKLTKTFFGSARYTKGLSHAFNQPNSLDNAKNHAFQFGIGFVF